MSALSIRNPNAKREIHRKVSGGIKMTIGDAIPICGEKASYCYKGTIEFSNSVHPLQATILVFDTSEDYSALTLFDYHSSICSRHVLNVLACIEGPEPGENMHTYLAFPVFEKTFANFIVKESRSTIENGRFSEDFVGVIRDVIKGLLALHQAGFYCPYLKGEHVAVISEDGHLTAKIWNFCLADSESAKLGDWDRLADKITLAAVNHNSYSLEISDFCERIRKGGITSLKALKHCALSSMEQKFSYILALNRYVLIFCEGHMPHPFVNDPQKTKVHDELVKFLAEVTLWSTNDMPEWIANVKSIVHRSPAKVENGAALIWELRCIIEHRTRYMPYIPPNKTGESSTVQETYEGPKDEGGSDREYEIRKAWEEMVLKILNFATDLELEY